MPEIYVLDKAVAELIAAGEVVERPSSIVKEILENSIDAGATNISVEISGGGVRMIRVSDNGCGISREDIPKAFMRHATSKVKDAGDLDGILTLGFRGEALASIAAMCRVELLTAVAGDTEGTLYTIEGGETVSCVPAARTAGTTITIRDVFFNTPARMKFLKKDISEGNSVAQIVDKCALSHPEIAFRFIRDGAVKLKTSGNGELLAVIYEIYGRDFANEMLAVDYVYENVVGVTGYISNPKAVKPSRNYQNFYINRRFVKTRTAAAALEEAYKNKIMSGKFPVCFLNLEIDAKGVDVNVHPAKLEVRFENEKPIFSAVYYAVKSALTALEAPLGVPVLDETSEENHEYETKIVYSQMESDANIAARPISMGASVNRRVLDISVDDDEQDFISYPLHKNYAKYSEQTTFDKKVPDGSDKIFYNTAINSPKTATTIVEINEPHDLRLIGEAFGTYIIIEDSGELVLVDKHAAHERILYEKLKSELSLGNRQVMLTAQSIALSREEHAALTENIREAEKLGFLIEDFGGSSIVVREVPVELAEADVAYILRELADKLISHKNDLTPNVLDRLYYNIACRAAVKANDKNSGAELMEIVKQLSENPAITHCPHGRPVLIRLSRREIEKMFGRLG